MLKPGDAGRQQSACDASAFSDAGNAIWRKSSAAQQRSQKRQLSPVKPKRQLSRRLTLKKFIVKNGCLYRLF
ncbi:hypothetical protein KCP76_10555 [Salmonella enterica subsp. enterica serovar Weltevreden]|nr:hypothetical protein KCP76_10555 [Salmonella enterica subsp. enterica serovar Weltevreden]